MRVVRRIYIEKVRLDNPLNIYIGFRYVDGLDVVVVDLDLGDGFALRVVSLSNLEYAALVDLERELRGVYTLGILDDIWDVVLLNLYQ